MPAATNSDLRAVRCFVSGRVQGVYYRGTTRQKAIELGLAGFAKNLADGRVEVLIVGPPQQVDALVKWLWIGSATARVTDVSVEALELDTLQDVPVGFGQG